MDAFDKNESLLLEEVFGFDFHKFDNDFNIEDIRTQRRIQSSDKLLTFPRTIGSFNQFPAYLHRSCYS